VLQVVVASALVALGTVKSIVTAPVQEQVRSFLHEVIVKAPAITAKRINFFIIFII
jgi:hypothetical protein